MMTTPASPDQHSPLAGTFATFFEVKTAADVGRTMSYFSPGMVTYTDAKLGWALDSYQALEALFEQYMPTWAPPARSYPTAVLSNDVSALVHMVDTPELFGGELRILAAVDFADGKIIRWVDYWDASCYDQDLYAKYRTPADRFPRDLKDHRVPTRAAPQLVAAATVLQQACAAADAPTAAELLHTDVAVEDRALRTHVLGKIEATSYLGRVLAQIPYGRDSTLRHVVGGDRGGGYEWTAGTQANGLPGITALELDACGLITKITSVYDSRQLGSDHKSALAAAATAF